MRTVLVHSEAYDDFFMIDKSTENYQKPYVVFIDQFVTGHPDSKKMGHKKPAEDSKNYFARLNSLFAEIEKDGYEVIIALHPVAEYTAQEFQGRKMIKGETALLIEKSEFVITQYSTAMNIITLAKKAFINLYDRQFFSNVPELRSCYSKMQGFFKCKQLDISDNEGVKNYKAFIFPYKKEIYDSYNELYVVPKESVGKEKLRYQIVHDYIIHKNDTEL